MNQLTLGLFQSWPVVNLATEEIFTVEACSAEFAVMEVYNLIGLPMPDEQLWIGRESIALGDFAAIYQDGV